MSDNGDSILYPTLGFGLGLYWFFKGFREFRKYRVLADTPVIPIRSMAMGLVEVHGTAQGEQQLSSPVSRTPCFWYKVQIEKWKKDSKGRGSWAHHLTDQNGVSFYLRDATGKVLVNLQNAELDLPQNSRREIGGGFTPGFISRFRGGKKADPTLGGGPSESELYEYIAGAGAGMAVPRLLAALSPSGDAATPGGGERRALSPEDARRELGIFRQQLRQKKAQEGLGGVVSLLRSGFMSRATSSSDRFRLTEYCIVPDRTYDVTGTCTENPSPKDEDDRNMIVQGENEPTFVISWRTEKEIEGHLRWRAMKYVFGGGILAVVCLAILVNNLGWL